MFEDLINEHLNSDRFGKCEECGEETCNSKLAEFNGKCEDCYYDR